MKIIFFLYYTFFFYALNKTPLGLSGSLGNPYFLLAAHASSSLINPPFPSTVNQTTVGTLPLTMQHLCDLQDTLLLHWSPSTSHLALTQRIRVFLQGWKISQAFAFSSHILPTSHRKVLLGRFHLCDTVCYGTLY